MSARSWGINQHPSSSDSPVDSHCGGSSGELGEIAKIVLIDTRDSEVSVLRSMIEKLYWQIENCETKADSQ